MFFNRTSLSTKHTKTPQNICILGTSSVALFIAEQLQNTGHQIKILCPPSEVDEYNSTDFVFKDNRHLKTKRSQFKCCFEQPASPDFLLIASKPQKLRSDLLLLSPTNLQNTTIINLTPSAPENFVSEALNLASVNAYFFGWLHQSQNHISLLSASPFINFTLSAHSEQFQNIQNLFDETEIETKSNVSAAHNFWQWLAPHAIIFLISEASDKSFYYCAQKPEYRQIIENCLPEIIALASSDNANLEKSDILRTLYSVPENYLSPFHSPVKTTQALLLERTTNMLFRSTSFNNKHFPIIKNLITQIINKL